MNKNPVACGNSFKTFKNKILHFKCKLGAFSGF
jgi:hypothetical protein